tara:strand:- start:513 stop:1208 length:696 start_codon:yes stop_codon:yes gene_type:complete
MKYKIINGLKVYAPLSRDQLIDKAKAEKRILIAINAEKILTKNENLKSIVKENIGYPDGFGAILALRRKGLNQVKKIPGCELWLEIIKKNRKESFFLIGGKQEVIQKTIDKLQHLFDDINIVGYRNGYFKNEEEIKDLKSEILLKKPTFIFVAMGSPRQEELMSEIHSIYKTTYMGLGGSFDVYVGEKKRAPSLFVNLNLEWLFRLIKEPFRIKRQIKLLKFLYYLLVRKI